MRIKLNQKLNKWRCISIFVLSIAIRSNGQQNWVAVPCFSVKPEDAVTQILKNNAQNEIIVNTMYSYDICGKRYKAFFAFDGAAFHDMDLGIEAQDINLYLGTNRLSDCASLQGKAFVTGAFLSVGRDTLLSKGIAEWDGTKWSQFSKPMWDNTPDLNEGGGISKMLEYNGGVYLFVNTSPSGSFIATPIKYDGSTLSPLPKIPVNNQSAITEALIYKNKLIVGGGFYDTQIKAFSRLAQFDGTSWSPVGNGIQGNLSAIQSMAIYNDTLYIGGSFPKGANNGGNAGNYLMKWDGTQLLDAGFNSTFCSGYSAIWSLVPFRGKLYAFGNFMCAAGQKAYGVAYYQDGKWTVPQDSIGNFSIINAVEYKDNIYIGGGFKSINGDTTIQKFAKLLCPDFDAATGCISGLKEITASQIVKVFPNPTTNKLTISTNNKVSVSNAIVVNVLGQSILQIGTIVDKQELDLSELATGVYYLKFELNDSQYNLKVLKE